MYDDDTQEDKSTSHPCMYIKGYIRVERKDTSVYMPLQEHRSVTSIHIHNKGHLRMVFS